MGGWYSRVIGSSPNRWNNTNFIIPLQKGSLNTLDYRIYYRNKNGPISAIHDIPLQHSPNVFNMIVEIPRWTNAKMEISRTDPLNPIRQDVKDGKLRYVKNAFPHHGYIWNYGALPQTWENPNAINEENLCRGDNDPIDVCEIGGKTARRGDLLQVKILGCFLLTDEGETDWKLLAVDVTDPLAEKLNDIEDIETHMPGYLKATAERFRTYKVPDGGKENPLAYNEQPKNAEFALGIIEETHRHWRELSRKEIKNEGGLALERTTDPESPFIMSIPEAEHIVSSNPPQMPPSRVDPLTEKWHFIPAANPYKKEEAVQAQSI